MMDLYKTKWDAFGLAEKEQERLAKIDASPAPTVDELLEPLSDTQPKPIKTFEMPENLTLSEYELAVKIAKTALAMSESEVIRVLLDQKYIISDKQAAVFNVSQRNFRELVAEVKWMLR